MNLIYTIDEKLETDKDTLTSNKLRVEIETFIVKVLNNV